MFDAADASTAPQLQQLSDLAEIGLEVARAIARRAQDAGPDEDLGALAMAYSRAARAVRLSIMLQSRLMDERKAAGQALGPVESPAAIRRARIEKIVERIAEEACGHDEDEVERLVDDAADRLDFEDYGDILERPMTEVVALICKDLGLEPDWAVLGQQAWAQAEIRKAPPCLPREAAGGGPLARPGEQRALEGAGAGRDSS